MLNITGRDGEAARFAPERERSNNITGENASKQRSAKEPIQGKIREVISEISFYKIYTGQQLSQEFNFYICACTKLRIYLNPEILICA